MVVTEPDLLGGGLLRDITPATDSFCPNWELTFGKALQLDFIIFRQHRFCKILLGRRVGFSKVSSTRFGKC